MKKKQTTPKAKKSKSVQQGGGTIWRARAQQRLAQRGASRRVLRTARRLGIRRS